MPKIPKFLFAITVNKPSQPFHKQLKNPSHTFGNNNFNPIYIEIAPVTHDLHDSKSYQKDIMIKTLTEILDSLTNRVQHVEGRKRLGLRYEDLFIHSDVKFPEGYNLPKFEMFNGIRDPKAHLSH